MSVGLCWTAAIVAVALGMWFRLCGLGTTPMWLDEAYSAFAADRGLSFIWHVVPRYDVHPPLYYSLLHGWDAAFGETLLVRRLLGLVCGSATMAVAAACGATLGGLIGEGRIGRALIATLATILVALQPMMIMMTQQIRPYPVMMLVYALGTLAILKIVAASDAGRAGWRGWAGLVFVVEALMLWLHSLGPLYAATLSLALLVALLPKRPDARHWLGLLAAQVAVGLLYLPAALMLRDQAPNWVQSTWLVFRPGEILANLAVVYLNPGLVIMIAGVSALVIGAVVSIRRRATTAAVALLLLGLLPTLLALLISLTLAPVFLPRTLSPAAIPMLILIGGSLGIARRWRGVVMALALILILPFAWADVQLTRLPPTEDWRGTVAWLSARIKPGDVVWAYPNESALPLLYAMHDAHRAFPVVQIPVDVPAIGYPGTRPGGGRATIALSVAQVDALMRTDAARRPPTIWLLGLASGDLMETALSRVRTPVARFRRDEIEVVGMARRDAGAAGAATPAHASPAP